MALTKSQQKMQIARVEKRLKKAQEAASEVEALMREVEWLKQAPVVDDKPRKPRKPRQPQADVEGAVVEEGAPPAA